MKLGVEHHPWGTALTGFGRPFGLGFDAAGRLHATDMDTHLLVRFDPSFSAFQWHDGRGGWSAPEALTRGHVPAAAKARPKGWHGPHSIAFDRNGAAYVTCYYGAAIHVLAPSGEPLRTIGEGLLKGPATGLFDRAGRLLVTDYALNAVLRMDPSGAAHDWLRGDFDRPHMARELADGTIVVADTWNDRLVRFAADGALLGRFGAAIARPVAVDQGSDGRLLAAAWGSDSVVSFRASDGGGVHRLLEPPLRKPYDARFTGEGVVVADSHQARVLLITPRWQDEESAS